MFYSASLLPFGIIICLYYLIPISGAIPSDEDKMLIAFVKGHQQIQISEYSTQKYEAHFGILYFMRNNWQCEKIVERFRGYERTECHKFRKYLDILYQYLFYEFVGIPKVKPKFVIKWERKENEGTIVYVMNCLAKISQFYFNNRGIYIYWNRSYYYNQPKMLNDQRLNYELNLNNEKKQMPINEMILQLAIDTANEWQTNEIVDIIMEKKFEENLGKMFKKAEERAKNDYKDTPWKINGINNDKHKIMGKCRKPKSKKQRFLTIRQKLPISAKI